MAMLGSRLGSSLASDDQRQTVRMNPLSRQSAGTSGMRGMRTPMVRSFQTNPQAMVGPVSQAAASAPPVYLKGSPQDPAANSQNVAQTQGAPARQPAVDMSGIYGPVRPVGPPIEQQAGVQGGGLPPYIIMSDQGQQYDLRNITNLHELSRLPDDVWKKLTGSDRLKEVMEPGEGREGDLGATPEGGLGNSGGYTGFGGIGSAVRNAMGYDTASMGRDLSSMGQRGGLAALGAVGAGAPVGPSLAYGAAMAGANPAMLGAKLINNSPRYWAAVREDQKMNDLARSLGLSEQDVAAAAKAGLSMSGFDKSVSGVDRSKFGRTDDMSPAMANLANQVADSVNSIRNQPTVVEKAAELGKKYIVDPVVDLFSKDDQARGYSPGEFAGYGGSVSAPDPDKFGGEGWGGFGGGLGSGWGNMGAGFGRGGYDIGYDNWAATTAGMIRVAAVTAAITTPQTCRTTQAGLGTAAVTAALFNG